MYIPTKSFKQNFLFFFFKGCTYSIWKFSGQGLNDLYHSSWQHLSEARDQTCILMDTSQTGFHCAMMGTPCIYFLFPYDSLCCFTLYWHLSISTYVLVFVFIFLSVKQGMWCMSCGGRGMAGVVWKSNSLDKFLCHVYSFHTINIY